MKLGANVNLSTKWLLGIFLSCTLPAELALGYELLGHKWENPQLTINVDIGGSSPSGTSWESAFSQATNRWNNVATGFEFDITKPYSHPCAGYPLEDGSIPFPEDSLQGADFHSSVCGTPFGEDTLAVTVFIYDSETTNFVDADIIFSEDVEWDTYSGNLKTRVDFTRVATHELGHFAGLGHETTNDSLMSPRVSNIERPTIDDIAGINALYSEEGPATVFAVVLEEPVDSLVHGGIGNLRGWALAETGIDRVEIHIDGKYMFDAPFGGERADVGSQFPEIPESDQSGFSLAALRYPARIRKPT